MADPKDIHDQDQMSGAIMQLAQQTFTFNRELRHNGLTRTEALSLSRVYLRTYMEHILNRIQISGSETPPE